jgi:hypothetical protein
MARGADHRRHSFTIHNVHLSKALPLEEACKVKKAYFGKKKKEVT